MVIDLTRRVVVTGLGVVSSIGIGWPDFWKNLIDGKSGISKISSFEVSGYDCQCAGEVKRFDPFRFIPADKAYRLGRASQMAIAATQMALEDAGWQNKDDDPHSRVAVCIGTTVGELGVLEDIHDLKEVHVLSSCNGMIRSFPSNSLSANIAAECGLHGYNVVFATACAAGNYAIGHAFNVIRSGYADCAVAGGADSFSRVIFTGFARLYAIAPEKCQPFDKNRKGMIPGEGAGIVFMETLESAEARQAPIYGEVLGLGLSCDASHMTNPDSHGIAKAIRKSLQRAGVDPVKVDYISAHGTGTKENDKAEAEAINEIFGDRTRDVPVSSIKSMLGHTMGAASALESISCCLAIKNNVIPPTINLEEQDPGCAIDCVPNVGRQRTVNIALNNASAFGGNNACVVLGKV